MNVNFTLLDDRIAVLPVKSNARSAGGIVLPEKAKREYDRGEVIAVGPGKFSERLGKTIAPVVRAGQTVQFQTYRQTEIECDGETLRVIGEEDVVAIFGANGT